MKNTNPACNLAVLITFAIIAVGLAIFFHII